MHSYWFRFGRPHDWLMHVPTYDLVEALRMRRKQDTVLFIYAWNDELIGVLDCTDVLKINPGERCTCSNCKHTYEHRLFRDIWRMIDDVKATEAFQ